MAKKLRVGVLFGGRSGEHEVSLLSAASVLKAIDRKKFDVVPIGITKEGRWLAAADATGLLGRQQRGARAGNCAPAIPKRHPAQSCCMRAFQRCSRPCPDLKARQAKRSTSSFPFFTAPSAKTAPSRVSSNSPASPTSAPASSAPPAGMDKDVMKRLFAQAGLPIVKHVTFLRSRLGNLPAQSHRRDRIRAQLSALCETRQSRLLGRHQQGARPQGTRPRPRPRRQL